MKKLHLVRKKLLVFILLSFSFSPIWADSQNLINKNFASISGSGNSVSWSVHPNIRYKSITLKLAPNNGEVVVINSIREPSVSALADGQYDYELVVTPLLDARAQAELKAARKAANGQETPNSIKKLKSQGILPQTNQTQSGHFTILNGQFVSPDTKEK